MWYYVQVAAYAGLILGYALLLFLAIRRRVGSGPGHHRLEISLLMAGLWVTGLGGVMLLTFGPWGAFLWNRLAEIGLVVIALFTAEFADAFVQRSARRWLWRGMVAGGILIALILDIFSLPWLAPLLQALPVRIQRLNLAALWLVLAWAVCSGRAWSSSWRALHRATGSKHRNRIRYLVAALIGWTVGDLLVLAGGIPDVYVGLIVKLLGFGIVTFSLLRYDLPDIKRFSLRALGFVVLSGLTATLYLVVLFTASRMAGVVPDVGRWQVFVPAISVALLAAASADVILRPRLQGMLNRTLLGQSYDVQRALRLYSQQINLILDPERLADTTLEWLRATLGVQRSAFILFTPWGDDRVELGVLRTRSAPVPAPGQFSAAGRFILHFRNVRRPLSQYDLDMLSWFQTVAAGERHWLEELGLDLYVPILVADRPVALLALGPKAGGQPYADDDVETLMTLAGQTGTALDNARLMDQLRLVQEDLHRLGTELAETNQQLRRLDQTKTDFITIASHELRTPLSQIYGYTDILTRLQGDDLSDSQTVQQFVAGITTGAARLKRVVDALVDLSLLETGSMRIDPELLPLGLVMQSAVEAVQAAACERNLTLTVQDFSHLPFIRADGGRLKQVFLSLLGNAIKFTPDGGEIVVSGRVVSTSAGNDTVELCIADNGIGIEPEQQKLIFEKFHRAESVLNHSSDDVAFKGAGPGLGLSIAKGIVKAHGGLIWAESPGRDEEYCPGSSFYLHLPVNGPGRDRDRG